MDYGGMTINLCVADSLKAIVTDHCKCGGKDCVFFMTDEEYKQYCERREEEGQPVEQQTFTTEIAEKTDTSISTERQGRAAQLTQRDHGQRQDCRKLHDRDGARSQDSSRRAALH